MRHHLLLACLLMGGCLPDTGTDESSFSRSDPPECRHFHRGEMQKCYLLGPYEICNDDVRVAGEPPGVLLSGLVTVDEPGVMDEICAISDQRVVCASNLELPLQIQQPYYWEIWTDAPPLSPNEDGFILCALPGEG